MAAHDTPAGPVRRPRARMLPGLLLAALLPALAQAWGPEGHRVIGELAQRDLDPRARAAVADLLRDEEEPTLAGVANWADDLRASDPVAARRTGRWHYVNFGARDCVFVPARDCRGEDCVVAAIDTELHILGDRARPRGERVEALKFVVHFIGDVHQPFHADDRDDRGGNDYQVSYHGNGGNLHAVWDSLVLDHHAGLPVEHAARLAVQPVAAADLRIDAGAPQRWAEESCRLVDAEHLYPAGHVIDDAYLLAHRALAEQRLRLAGARLAAELNGVLGNGARD